MHVSLLRQLKLDSVVWSQGVPCVLLLRREDLQGCSGRVLLEFESLAQIWLVARKQLFNPGSAQIPAQQGLSNRVNERQEGGFGIGGLFGNGSGLGHRCSLSLKFGGSQLGNG